MSDITPGNSPSGHTPSKGTRNAALFGMGAVLLGLGLAAGLIMHKVSERDSTPMTPASQTAYQSEADQQKFDDQLKQQGAANAQRDSAATTRDEPRSRPRSTQHAATTTTRQPARDYNDMPPTAAGPSVCPNCGTVESVHAVQVQGQGSGVGAVTGGVLGGVVGNQMGKGSGNAAMTVLGAIGGGIAGNEIEKSQKRSTVYEVKVRMDDGTTRTFSRKEPTATGTRVEVSGNGFYERGSSN